MKISTSVVNTLYDIISSKMKINRKMCKIDYDRQSQSSTVDDESESSRGRRKKIILPKEVRYPELFQYLGIIFANLINVGYGASIAWYEVSSLQFKSVNTPLGVAPIDSYELSWIGILLCIGAVFGTIFVCWMASGFGAKYSICLMIIPQLCSWALIILGTNESHLYLSRILSGFAAGGSLVTIPLFVCEIAQPHIRGRLLMLQPIAIYFGSLLAYVGNQYLAYKSLAYTLSSINILFIIGMIFVRDSPIYLWKFQKKEEAEKSLQLFRNSRRPGNQLTQFYLDELDQLQSHGKGIRSMVWEDLVSRAFLRATAIGLTVIVVRELCGWLIMIQYMKYVLLTVTTGSDIIGSVNILGIIVSGIQLFGSGISFAIIDRIGRKPLMIISTIGTGISLICLGLHDYLNQIDNIEYHLLHWLPLIGITMLSAASSMGIITVPYVIIPELLPEYVRYFGTAFCLVVSWCLQGFSIWWLPDIFKYNYIGFEVLCPVGVCLMAATGLVWYFIPETKRLALAVIQMEMERR